MRPWDGKPPIGGTETFALLNGERGKPLIDPKEWVEYIVSNGLNGYRLMPWNRHDVYPPWGSRRWWHRMERHFRLALKEGVYVIASIWPGVHPDDELGRDGLDACREFTERFSIDDYPNILVEPGNEIEFPSYRNGEVQEATNIFTAAGFPTLHCPSDGAWNQIDQANIQVAATIKGYDDEVHSSPRGRAVFTDHDALALRLRHTEGKIAYVRKMKAGGARVFIGSGTWTDGNRVTHSLAGWHRPLDEQFNLPEVLQVISEEFVQAQPPQPEPGPEQSPPQDAARKFGALWEDYRANVDSDVGHLEGPHDWSKEPRTQQLMAEFRKHLMRESPEWARRVGEE